MIPIINKIQIDVACLGNHEFDYGANILIDLLNTMNPSFPWILSNFIINEERLNSLSMIETSLIKNINGVKIGFIGLIEKELIDSCPTFFKIKYEYEDFVDCAKRYVKIFQEEQCDLIIALTHMRDHNNQKLAINVPEIEIQLAGHDHFVSNRMYNNVQYIISGTDFQNLTYSKVIIEELTDDEHIKIENNPLKEFLYLKENNFTVKNVLYNITKTKKITIETQLSTIDSLIEPDKETEDIVHSMIDKLKEEFSKPLFNLLSPVDSRSCYIRKTESAIGNFITDVMRLYYKVDCSRKQVADVYQINHEGVFIIYLVMKDALNAQNYKFIYDYLFSGSNLKVENIVLFNSKHCTSFMGYKEEEKKELKNKLFVLKNKVQLQSNQLIRGEELTCFNGFTGFYAYLFTKANLFNIPCVIFVGSYEENEININSISVFNQCGITYSFLKDKLTEEYLKKADIDLCKVFYEFNSTRNTLYS